MLTNNLATNETFYKGKLRYNLDADLAPISLTHSTAHTLLVRKRPARTVLTLA